MLKWIKQLRLIVSGYSSEMENTRARISALEKLIRDSTNIAVDVEFKSANHVIVVGRYKNADYVQTYSLDAPDLASLISQLRAMERTATVKRVDSPPQLRAVFERELHLGE